MAVMVDKLHHRAEGQRVGEAILSLPMEDLYQFVVASFPEGKSMWTINYSGCFSFSGYSVNLALAAEPTGAHTAEYY